MQHSGLLSGGPAWEKAGFSICPLWCLHLASDHQTRPGLEWDRAKRSRAFDFCAVFTEDSATHHSSLLSYMPLVENSAVPNFLWSQNVSVFAALSKCLTQLLKLRRLSWWKRPNVQCRGFPWPGLKNADLKHLHQYFWFYLSITGSEFSIWLQFARDIVSQTSFWAPQRIHTFALSKKFLFSSPTQKYEATRSVVRWRRAKFPFYGVSSYGPAV